MIWKLWLFMCYLFSAKTQITIDKVLVEIVSVYVPSPRNKQIVEFHLGNNDISQGRLILQILQLHLTAFPQRKVESQTKVVFCVSLCWLLLRTVFCMSCMYACCGPACIVFCFVLLFCLLLLLFSFSHCAHLVPVIKSPHLFQISNQPFPFKESFVC